MLTASARERQDAKVQRVTVELTVEEERRQFEADVMERASEAIAEVGAVPRLWGWEGLVDVS